MRVSCNVISDFSYYHWISVPENSEILHCGIFLNMLNVHPFGFLSRSWWWTYQQALCLSPQLRSTWSSLSEWLSVTTVLPSSLSSSLWFTDKCTKIYFWKFCNWKQAVMIGHVNSIPTMQFSLDFPEILSQNHIYPIIDLVCTGFPK